jgi:hypothetical protein
MNGAGEPITDDQTAPEIVSEAAADGAGPLRVLALAAIGCILIGSVAFGASTVVHSSEPVVHTMCADSTCTYAASAVGATPDQPARPHRSRSAPERFARSVLYFCHVR